MDIILHVGAHRTGTTTFQAYLRRNRERLAELKIAVWEPERMRGGLAHGLLGAPGPMTPEALRLSRRATGLIKIEWLRLQQAGYQRLLVSEENLIGSPRENLRAGSLYPHAAARLARFVRAFASRCSRVIVSTRSYEEYWSSALAFALPNGWPLPGAEKLDRLVTQPRRWRHVIEDLANVFPLAEFQVLPFEAMIGRPEAQLAAMLGEPVPPMEAARRWLHSSPTRDMLRQVLIDRGERAMLPRIPPGAGRWQPFDEGHIEILRAIYAEDMAWLAAGGDRRAGFVDGVGPVERWLPGVASAGKAEGYGDDGWQRRAAAGGMG